MEQRGVVLDGYPSDQEIKDNCGMPDEKRQGKGPMAIVECVQPIPCNPCESACPFQAISVGEPITNIPKVDWEKCTGCGQCVSACSGLAIFIVDKSLPGGRASVSFPFEYLPLPQKGDVVTAVGRDGLAICDGVVLRVIDTKKSDHTAVVTLEVPLEHVDQVRSMGRIGFGGAQDLFTPVADFQKAIEDDVLVCRCEEVTAGEIRKAIRDMEGMSVTQIKRRVRCGMGLCQGKSCGRLVSRIIGEETGQKPEELQPSTDRPPVRPVTFSELAGGGEDA